MNKKWIESQLPARCRRSLNVVDDRTLRAKITTIQKKKASAAARRETKYEAQRKDGKKRCKDVVGRDSNGIEWIEIEEVGE